MQFEQLALDTQLFEQFAIDTQRFDRPIPITYRVLDNDGKIYCKIDWLTVMFFDCSMNDVLAWLHIFSLNIVIGCLVIMIKND